MYICVVVRLRTFLAAQRHWFAVSCLALVVPFQLRFSWMRKGPPL